MLPRWLARELRTLFLSLCLWTSLHSSIKRIKWLLLKWPLDMCVNPMDRQTMCVDKDWFIELAMHHTVEQQWRLLFFFSLVEMTLFLIFTFIFIYFYMKLWFQIQKCHYSTWRGYCFCVFAYMYICMYASYVLYVSPRFLETLVTVLMWARRRRLCF